jgi:hypothetical protein
MHFFGLWGSISFILGTLLLGYLSYAKLFNNEYNMTQRPMFFLGLLLIIFGTQMFVTGFLADLVSRSSADRNFYLIEEKVNIEK